MQKTISAPCASAGMRQFSINTNISQQPFPAPIKLVKAMEEQSTVILSPTNVNNKVVTRELKLVSLDMKKQVDNTRSSSRDSGAQSQGASESSQPSENSQPVVQVKKKFEKIRAKFSMKRSTSKQESTIYQFEENSMTQPLTRTKTQNDQPKFNKKQVEKMKRTVTCPDAVDIVSYISPPLGDFRHTAHLGHHGESFGDLSFLNSTKIEYTDKNAGLRNNAAGKAGRKSASSKRNSLEESALSTDCNPNSEISDEFPSIQADSFITDTSKENKTLLSSFLESMSPPSSGYFQNLKKSFNLEGHHSDSAIESTSLTNSSEHSSEDKRVIALIDIERDISQVGTQDQYLESFDFDSGSAGCGSSMVDSNSLQSGKHVRRGSNRSNVSAGRFKLGGGVNSLVDEMMMEFEKLKATNKV